MYSSTTPSSPLFLIIQINTEVPNPLHCSYYGVHVHVLCTGVHTGLGPRAELHYCRGEGGAISHAAIIGPRGGTEDQLVAT